MCFGMVCQLNSAGKEVIEMGFAYYHIIQYLFGILLSFIGLRFAFAYFKLIMIRGFHFDFVMCFVGSSLLMASGLYLTVMPWGLKTWLVGIGLFAAGRILGRIVYIVDSRRAI